MTPLHKRILTALVLIPVTFTIFYQGPHAVQYFAWTLIVGMIGEWVYNLLKVQKLPAIKLYLLALGTPYIIFGTLGFLNLYSGDHLLALIFLTIIWITDTSAFFIGRSLKGPKLWPAVSPNKTWSGAIGGVLVVVLYGFILNIYLFDEEFFSINTLALFVTVSVVGQAGDLLESAAKRYLKIKDTSQLLPGHGGLLDRLDSFLAVGLLVYFLR